MAGDWTWSDAQWRAIVALAHAERSNRLASRGKDPVSQAYRSGSLARANEAAAYMRAWAERAQSGRSR